MKNRERDAEMYAAEMRDMLAGLVHLCRTRGGQPTSIVVHPLEAEGLPLEISGLPVRIDPECPLGNAYVREDDWAK